MKDRTITLNENERGYLYATLNKTRDKFQRNYVLCCNEKWYRRKYDLLKGLLEKLKPKEDNNE